MYWYMFTPIFWYFICPSYAQMWRFYMFEFWTLSPNVVIIYISMSKNVNCTLPYAELAHLDLIFRWSMYTSVPNISFFTSSETLDKNQRKVNGAGRNPVLNEITAIFTILIHLTKTKINVRIKYFCTYFDYSLTVLLNVWLKQCWNNVSRGPFRFHTL